MLLKIWEWTLNSILKLILLTTFLGIPPLVAYIYYGVYLNNLDAVLIGSIAIVTIAHINKAVQGGK